MAKVQTPTSTEIDNIEVRFSLSPEVPTVRIDNVHDLRYTFTKKEGKDYSSEIVLVVPTKNIDEAVSKATKKVRLLCNLISFKCKKGVVPTYAGTLIKYTDGHTSVSSERTLKVWSDNDLELDANEINNIENDPKHSMYHHFAQSFIALLSYNDHATIPGNQKWVFPIPLLWVNQLCD
jgi:hypothetical protein